MIATPARIEQIFYELFRKWLSVTDLVLPCCIPCIIAKIQRKNVGQYLFHKKHQPNRNAKDLLEKIKMQQTKHKPRITEGKKTRMVGSHDHDLNCGRKIPLAK